MTQRFWRQRCVPFVVALTAAAALLGCKQDPGDPCKEDNDCAGGKICCKRSIMATTRGVCRPEGECDPGGTGLDAGGRDEEDAGEADDSGATDAAPDAGGDADATADGG